MEKDAGGSIVYFLSIPQAYKNDLARIRQWTNLKASFDENIIWIRDLNYQQVYSTEVRSIPFATAYYEKSNQLYLLDRKLPERNVPGLLWTPIDRALPVKLPSLNHNYFGIHDTISITMVPSDRETDAVAMIVSLDVLSHYIENAPAVRLEKIRWAVLGSNQAFLLGTPLLPIPGTTVWSRKDLLFPTGYDFELHSVSDVIQKKINPGRDSWILWDTDNSYQLISKESLVPLSRSSFRVTITNPLQQS
jgi:hypothetical protein